MKFVAHGTHTVHWKTSAFDGPDLQQGDELPKEIGSQALTLADAGDTFHSAVEIRLLCVHAAAMRCRLCQPPAEEI